MRRVAPSRCGYVKAVAVVVAMAMGVTVAACSGDGGDAGGNGGSDSLTTLTMYSGQHEELAKSLAAEFEKAKGIKVRVRAGDDAELVNQIIEEGQRSNADIVLTEEPGPMAQLAAKGLLTKVDKSTEAIPDQRFVPKDGMWLPFAGRSRVIFYNPNIIAEDELPRSILELGDAKWKGRFAYAPSGAFVTTVSYMINEMGKEKTLAWLKGIKANGIDEQKNGKVRDSVEAGQHDFGLANHYYWYVLAADKGGEDKLESRVHYMSGGDPGALVLASGAAVLKSSKHGAEGQEFLAWLVDPDGGQRVVATETPQYPMTPSVKSSFDLKPLDQLDPPELDQGSLSDVVAAKDLLIQAGIV